MGDCELLESIYGESTIDNAFRLLSEYHALLILGPPGTGKTTLARCLAYKLGADLLEVTVHGWFSRMDLIGGYVLQGGDTVWRDGILLRAIKSGKKTLILLDEVNRGEPEKFLAELFTALSRPDKKLSIPNTDTAQYSNDILMAFFGNPFSIINSYRMWKRGRGEYLWGLKSDDIYMYFLSKLEEYLNNGRRVFAGVFFYGRTYLNNKSVLRILALFGEILKTNSSKGDENVRIAREYMLNENFRLILRIKPLAYLKVLNNEEKISIIDRESGKELGRLSNIPDLRNFVENKRYIISLNIGDKGAVIKAPVLIRPLSDRPLPLHLLPLNYALGRWGETLTVRGFLRELELTGLYEFTEDGKRYLNSGNEESVEIPLDNIYIVATANTADIGVLGGLGFALQRRFKVVRIDARREALDKALGVFNKSEYKGEVGRIWDALEGCLRDRLGRGYEDYMPGWSYFIDYIKLREAGFSIDEACRSVFNIYIERLECRLGCLNGHR